VPVPLPSSATADLAPPDAAEVEFFTRGLVSAADPGPGLTATQDLLMRAIARAMTGHPAAGSVEPIGPDQFALGMARRTLEFRTRIVQLMVLLALVLRPLPPEVVDRVSAFARELQVDESMLEVAGRFASGSLGLAAVDFERNGYTADWRPEDMQALHTSKELSDAWETAVADSDLAARWAALEDLAPGTLGRRVTEFYRSRGFVYPGRTGSAPPLLAQHDWVHVIADYGTSVESELEVFAFIARANDDMRAFSLLAMVISLFETGYLRTGAGLFEASPGHLSERGMATRLADAMRRGALCAGSVDYLRTDWFELAPLGIAEVRDHFGVVEKAPEARVAGSVGPWELGGISPFQLRAGQTMADAEGRPYESYGAQVAP
jgi:hypothetical protein